MALKCTVHVCSSIIHKGCSFLIAYSYYLYYSSAAVRESDGGDGTRNIEVHSPTSDTAQEEIKREQPTNEKMSLQVAPDQKSDDRSWQTRSRIGKCSVICEVVVLTLVMLVIIGLFQIPTVYYVLAVAVSYYYVIVMRKFCSIMHLSIVWPHPPQLEEGGDRVEFDYVVPDPRQYVG